MCTGTAVNIRRSQKGIEAVIDSQQCGIFLHSVYAVAVTVYCVRVRRGGAIRLQPTGGCRGAEVYDSLSKPVEW